VTSDTTAALGGRVVHLGPPVDFRHLRTVQAQGMNEPDELLSLAIATIQAAAARPLTPAEVATELARLALSAVALSGYRPDRGH
jgi:hypothetical protein